MADEEIPQEEAQEPAPPPLPAFRIVVEDYNPDNPDHYAQWVVSGKPNLSDNPPWQPYFEEDLGEDGETYVRRPQKQPVESSVTDVERMSALFAQAQQAAPEALNQLKGTVWAALVAGGMDQAEATAAGVALVLRHGALMAAFEAAGGHPLAAQALYAAISSPESVAALPWITAPILAIFAAALTPGA